MPTATTTTIAAFRTALVAVIRAACPDVQVDYGQPVSVRNEAIWLGATVPSDHEQVSLKAGRMHRREDYTTLVRFDVSSRADYPENEARCVALASAVESAVADKTAFTGTVDGVLWVVVGEMTMASSISPQKTPNTTIELIVNVKADLR